MAEFHLKIVSCNGVFFDGQCESLVVPTTKGEYGILANHESMVVGICIGELRFKTEGVWNDIVTGQGYARISDNQVILMVDTAERPEDVDENRARAAAERAREILQVKQSRNEYYRSQFAMTRAMARLKIKEKKYM